MVRGRARVGKNLTILDLGARIVPPETGRHAQLRMVRGWQGARCDREVQLAEPMEVPIGDAILDSDRL